MTARRTDDEAVAADVLVDAFTDDPFMSWIFSEPETHVTALGVWWAFIIGARPEGAELWLADDHTAAALWHPPRLRSATAVVEPGHADGGSTVADDDDVDPFVAMMTPLVGGRLGEVLDFFTQVMQAHPEEPHWYLPAVGTRVAAQGTGRGRRLLEPVLRRCDEEGLAAYLESSNPRNIPFYHRQRFEVIGELTTPDGTTVVTSMLRRP